MRQVSVCVCIYIYMCVCVHLDLKPENLLLVNETGECVYICVCVSVCVCVCVSLHRDLKPENLLLANETGEYVCLWKCLWGYGNCSMGLGCNGQWNWILSDSFQTPYPTQSHILFSAPSHTPPLPYNHHTNNAHLSMPCRRLQHQGSRFRARR